MPCTSMTAALTFMVYRGPGDSHHGGFVPCLLQHPHLEVDRSMPHVDWNCRRALWDATVQLPPKKPTKYELGNFLKCIRSPCTCTSSIKRPLSSSGLAGFQKLSVSHYKCSQKNVSPIEHRTLGITTTTVLNSFSGHFLGFATCCRPISSGTWAVTTAFSPCRLMQNMWGISQNIILCSLKKIDDFKKNDSCIKKRYFWPDAMNGAAQNVNMRILPLSLRHLAPSWHFLPPRTKHFLWITL